MDAPKVIYGLNEFNLDISLYAWKTPRADHPADDIAPLRVRDDDRLAGGEITGKPENCSIVEHNYSSGFFLGGLGLSRRRLSFVSGETSNRDGNFQANRV
jgi:hypothetical protein